MDVVKYLMLQHSIPRTHILIFTSIITNSRRKS